MYFEDVSDSIPNLSEVMAALARRKHAKSTKAQRSAAARKAVNARWAKARKKGR